MEVVEDAEVDIPQSEKMEEAGKTVDEALGSV